MQVNLAQSSGDVCTLNTRVQLSVLLLLRVEMQTDAYDIQVRQPCAPCLAGEDLFAYDNFFFKMRGGVFLEMGALDGFTFSNTLLFERYLGWRVH